MLDVQLDLNNILVALGVVLAILAIIAAVWKGVDAWRKLTRKDEKKATELAMNTAISQLYNRVTKCEERLARGDVQFVDIKGDMTQVLTVLNAMLMHFISGNDNAKLRGVKEDMDAYISRR